MSSEITIAKSQLKTELVTGGLKVMEFVPPRITPPIVIINSASPYIVPSSLSREYVLSLELVLVSATADNKLATEALDQLIQDTLNAVLPVGYVRVTSVGAPYNLQTNNTEYLSANVSIDLQITI